MERLAKLVKEFHSLTIFAKRSMLYVQLGSEFAAGLQSAFISFSLNFPKLFEHLLSKTLKLFKYLLKERNEHGTAYFKEPALGALIGCAKG